MHARAAGSRDSNERDPLSEGSLYSQGYHLADHGTHTSAYEAILHGRNQGRTASQLSTGIDDSVVQPGGPLRRRQLFRVGLTIDEFEGVGRHEIGVESLVRSFVEEHSYAFVSADLEVVTGLGT